MQDSINFLKNKRNLTSILILILMALSIPIALNLAQRSQILKSRADNPPILFSGNNVVSNPDKPDIPRLKPDATPNGSSTAKYHVDIILTAPVSPPAEILTP